MKKIKIVTGLTTLATLGGTSLAILSSCSCNNGGTSSKSGNITIKGGNYDKNKTNVQLNKKSYIYLKPTSDEKQITGLKKVIVGNTRLTSNQYTFEKISEANVTKATHKLTILASAMTSLNITVEVDTDGPEPTTPTLKVEMGNKVQQGSHITAKATIVGMEGTLPKITWKQSSSDTGKVTFNDETSEQCQSDSGNNIKIYGKVAGTVTITILADGVETVEKTITVTPKTEEKTLTFTVETSESGLTIPSISPITDSTQAKNFSFKVVNGQEFVPFKGKFCLKVPGHDIVETSIVEIPKSKQEVTVSVDLTNLYTSLGSGVSQCTITFAPTSKYYRFRQSATWVTGIDPNWTTNPGECKSQNPSVIVPITNSLGQEETIQIGLASDLLAESPDVLGWQTKTLTTGDNQITLTPDFAKVPTMGEIIVMLKQETTTKTATISLGTTTIPTGWTASSLTPTTVTPDSPSFSFDFGPDGGGQTKTVYGHFVAVDSDGTEYGKTVTTTFDSSKSVKVNMSITNWDFTGSKALTVNWVSDAKLEKGDAPDGWYYSGFDSYVKNGEPVAFNIITGGTTDATGYFVAKDSAGNVVGKTTSTTYEHTKQPYKVSIELNSSVFTGSETVTVSWASETNVKLDLTQPTTGVYQYSADSKTYEAGKTYIFEIETEGDFLSPCELYILDNNGDPADISLIELTINDTKDETARFVTKANPVRIFWEKQTSVGADVKISVKFNTAGTYNAYTNKTSDTKVGSWTADGDSSFTNSGITLSTKTGSITGGEASEIGFDGTASKAVTGDVVVSDENQEIQRFEDVEFKTTFAFNLTLTNWSKLLTGTTALKISFEPKATEKSATISVDTAAFTDQKMQVTNCTKTITPDSSTISITITSLDDIMGLQGTLFVYDNDWNVCAYNCVTIQSNKDGTTTCTINFDQWDVLPVGETSLTLAFDSLKIVGASFMGVEWNAVGDICKGFESVYNDKSVSEEAKQQAAEQMCINLQVPVVVAGNDAKETLEKNLIGRFGTVKINGRIHSVRCIGVLHDVDVDGNYIALTFELSSLLSGSNKEPLYSEWGNDNRDFTSSTLLKNLNSESDDAVWYLESGGTSTHTNSAINMIADPATGTPKLANCIIPAKKSVGLVSGGKWTVGTYTNKLFPLTMVEMGYPYGPEVSQGFMEEGKPYKYFKDNYETQLSRKLFTSGDTIAGKDYWLSTPLITIQGAYYIDLQGKIDPYQYMSLVGSKPRECVTFAFCI